MAGCDTLGGCWGSPGSNLCSSCFALGRIFRCGFCSGALRRKEGFPGLPNWRQVGTQEVNHRLFEHILPWLRVPQVFHIGGVSFHVDCECRGSIFEGGSGEAEVANDPAPQRVAK